MTFLPTLGSSHAPTQAATRLASFREAVDQELQRLGREKGSVRIVATSRALMADPVTHLAQAGMRDFCEEFLPEGVSKRPVVDAKVTGLTWHFAGRLVPQKMPLVLESFDWIHTLDRATLVRPLKEALQARTTPLHVLIEVNPLGNSKRLGCSEEDLPELIEATRAIPGMTLQGLSFRTEHFIDLEEASYGFKKMKEIQEDMMNQEILHEEMSCLAMGASRDYREALAQGATFLRVGTALFGEEAYRVMGGNPLETFDL